MARDKPRLSRSPLPHPSRGQTGPDLRYSSSTCFSNILYPNSQSGPLWLPTKHHLGTLFLNFFFHYQPPKGSFQTFFLFLIATPPPLCNLHPVSPMVITYLITVPNSNYSSNQKTEQWSNLCGDAKKHTNFKMLADSTFSICQTLTSKKQLSLVSAPAPL